jgi:hypothetical protein
MGEEISIEKTDEGDCIMPKDDVKIRIPLSG